MSGRRDSEDLRIPENNDDIDNSAMNVVVNTKSGGSEVTVTITNGKKEEKTKQDIGRQGLPLDDEIYENHSAKKDLENDQLLREIRNLLVTQKMEEEHGENVFDLPYPEEIIQN